ncbi:MAG TPA: hypothetical protein VFA34_16470 [Actinomycetota bacterium]|jgi:hypothetical protein|nr:hypothetical protein [Actinomycetota bacterium]
MRKAALAMTICAFPALVLGACASGGAAKNDVEDAVRASFRAENAKDIDAFLALWTDKGLESYDVGSRKELRDPKSEQHKGFGSEKARIMDVVTTTVREGRGTLVLDAALVGGFAQTLYRLQYTLKEEAGDWLIDGFEFKGSPPPKEGTSVVDTTAVEYGFVLSEATTDADFALKFMNKGKEQHELTLFKGPDATDLATAKKDLENIDGETLEPVPEGYSADHLSFADPGQTQNVSFARPFTPGTYFLACYMPQGGLRDNGEPINPNGKPHIQLGMINVLTVK